MAGARIFNRGFLRRPLARISPSLVRETELIPRRIDDGRGLRMRHRRRQLQQLVGLQYILTELWLHGRRGIPDRRPSPRERIADLFEAHRLRNVIVHPSFSPKFPRR